MATATTTTTTFINKLLAPLPEGEELARTPKFLRQLKNDTYRPWRTAMMHVDLAKSRHPAAALERQLGLVASEKPSLETYHALIVAQRRQCMILAPTVKELRWKMRLCASTRDTPEIKAVIAVDRKRLRVKEA